MEQNYAEMGKAFGEYEKHGITYAATQQPYKDTLFCLDGLEDGDYYRAPAIDEDLNKFELFWPVVNADAEDESDACIWEHFYVKES